MTRKLQSRLASRQYKEVGERLSFAAGYNDGYAGRSQGSAKLNAKRFPNAYNAGYWEGYADKREPKE